MKKIYSLLLSFFVILSSTAQTPKNYTIKGIALDSLKMEALSFATVVMKDSTTIIKAVASETSGKFTLKHDKSGKYTVTVNFVGYRPLEKQIILDEEATVDLGEFILSDNSQLGEITVTAPLITSDIDKTVYNTAADPETPALTALEMMRKVPMISVDGEDNIQLKGQGNYKILVNGKSNSMMSRDYKEVLRSMPASSIKSIEVITNPPAKYDAEGIAGIINIITIRKTNDAYNGSLSLRGDSFGGIGANGYIAAAIGKFNISAGLRLGTRKSPEGTSWSKTTGIDTDHYMYTNSDSRSSNSGKNLSYNIEASYEIDTFNLVTLSMWSWNGYNDNESDSYTEQLNPDKEILRAYRSTTNNNYKFGNTSGSLDWQKTYLKPDKTFTMSYQFDMGPGGRSYESLIKGLDGYPELYPDRSQRSTNKNRGDEHTFQVDFFNPLTKEHSIEFGLKYILRPNTSDTHNEKLENDVWVDDLTRKNDLDYLQHIVGAYGGYQFKLKKFSIKGGLRAEYTLNTGTFKLEKNHSLFNRNFNVVPYITTAYKLDDSKTLRLGYTQRLNRPGIWYLNPYIDDVDPQNIRSGNPNLESEVRHSFDFSYGSYSSKGNINTGISANFGNNSIENVTTRENGISYSTYENCGINKNLTVHFYGGLNFLEGKLRVNIHGNGGYTVVQSSINSANNNRGFNGGGGMGITAQAWKNGTVSANGGVWSGGIGLQSNRSVHYFNNFSISQAFFKNKSMRLNVGISNPFQDKFVYSGENYGEGFRSIYESTRVTRSVNFGVQWNFGKAMVNVKKARRGITNDDKMSGGSNGSSGGGE